MDHKFKCGEILLQTATKYKIFYTCSFCDKELGKVKQFIKHIFQHIKTDAESIQTESIPESCNEEEHIEYCTQTDVGSNDDMILFEVGYLYDEDGEEKTLDTAAELEEVSAVKIKTEPNNLSLETFEYQDEIEYNGIFEENFNEEQRTNVEESNDVKYEPTDSVEIELLNIEMESPSNIDNHIDDNLQQSIKQEENCKVKSLKSHLKSTEEIGQRKKLHKCEFCEVYFSDNSNLRVHRFRHLGIKPHPCKMCEKRFTSSTELKLHLRSHTGERPYVCQDCGRSFSNSAHLTSHRRRHLNERPHSCPTCDKRFFDKKTMRDHAVSHTNERPFVCDHCKATFSRQKALVEHRKLHSDVKKYLCKICGKAFAQNAGLHSHMKHQHALQR